MERPTATITVSTLRVHTTVIVTMDMNWTLMMRHALVSMEQACVSIIGSMIARDMISIDFISCDICVSKNLKVLLEIDHVT